MADRVALTLVHSPDPVPTPEPDERLIRRVGLGETLANLYGIVGTSEVLLARDGLVRFLGYLQSRNTYSWLDGFRWREDFGCRPNDDPELRSFLPVCHRAHLPKGPNRIHVYTIWVGGGVDAEGIANPVPAGLYQLAHYCLIFDCIPGTSSMFLSTVPQWHFTHSGGHDLKFHWLIVGYQSEKLHRIC